MKNVFLKLEEHIKSSYKSERREELENELDKILGNRASMNNHAIRLNDDEVKSRLTNERDREMIGAYFEPSDEYDEDAEEYSINLNYNLLTNEFTGNDIRYLKEVLDETMPLQSVINDILESAQRVLNVMDDIIQEIITDCEDTLNEYIEICKNNIKIPDVESEEFRELVRKYVHATSNNTHIAPQFIISETLQRTIPLKEGYRHGGAISNGYVLIVETKDYADVYYLNTDNETIHFEKQVNNQRIQIGDEISFDDILENGTTINGYNLSETIETYRTLKDYFETL